MASSSLFLIFIVGISLICGSSYADLDVKVERIIDLSTQFTAEECYYGTTNTGSAFVNSFEVAIKKDNLSHWYISKVTEKQITEQETTEKLSPIQNEFVRVETLNNEEYNIMKVTFDKPLGANQEIIIKVETIHTHEMTPKPPRISQAELQQMLWSGNLYAATTIPVSRQAVQVRCMQAISYTEDYKPVAINEQKQMITFGPYFDVPAWSYTEIYVHFFNTARFITVDSLVRDIEVSHWGNVAVEESFVLHHGGTPLEGTFSRLDYMMGRTGNSIPQFVQHLPQGAHEIYYRDIIGNISTSHVSRRADFVNFEIIPRFVMFGGWQDEFKIGYNLPTNPYLTVQDNRYVLDLPFVNNFDDAVFDNVLINIILPEGASNVDVSSSVEFFDKQETTKKTYLDTTGRVVISIRASNLVSEHRYQRLVVSYDFETSGMVREPLFLIAGFCCFFLAAIVYFRTNITIHDMSHLEDENTAKAKQLSEEFLSILKQRDAKYEPMSGRNAAKKLSQFNSDMNSSFSRAQAILSKLANVDSELASKARPVEQASKLKTTTFRALQQAQTSKADKLKTETLNEEYAQASSAYDKKLNTFSHFVFE